MSAVLEVSGEAARRAAVASQLLSGTNGREGLGNAGSPLERTAGLVEHLGYVQIDTISVVERAHHHTLWSREGRYRPEIIHRLQSMDRRVFEYWGHAASYLPIRDYRFYIPRMRRFRDPVGRWARDRLESCGHLMDEVLERIRTEGPLGSRDFRSDPGVSRAGWWDWKPAKTALELLFWRGDLMVTRRESFQRIYDLTERVLPPGTDTTEPSDEELERFLVERALTAHGIADARTVAGHIDAAGADRIRDRLADMVAAGEVDEVSVEGESGYYCLSKEADRLFSPAPDADCLRILSPFDNLIIDRRRLKDLFGFSYALECYTPAGDRKYGYFVLPVLRGDCFAARIDARADRKSRVLQLLSVHFEDGRSDDGLVPLLATGLEDFCALNGCRSVEVFETSPKSMKVPLKKGIAEVFRE